MKTILITGTSSGIGNAAAELFAQKGWRVFAGSRQPDPSNYKHNNIEPVKIDVNSAVSIAAFFMKLKKNNTTLDCVVNNAGWGVALPFENTPHKEIESVYRTNVFGLMEVCRAACVLMREQRHGTIINIASVAGQVGLPLYSVYSSTKWAVEGFSEALWHEIRPFNVHVKIVEPGGVKTDFFQQAYDPKELENITTPYLELFERRQAMHEKGFANYTPPEKIANIIHEAATDDSFRLRYLAGEDAKGMYKMKRELSEQKFVEKIHERYFG